MRLVKVFNNNAVLGVDERGTEVVLVGRGLGFRVYPGSSIDPALVERTFVPTDAAAVDRLAALVGGIPIEDIELTERIVEVARAALGDHVTEHVILPLADHIAFALRRAAVDAPGIDYPLRWEVQTLYRAEVAVARQALAMIQDARGVRLPEEEAIPVALHFVNAQFGVGDIETTVAMTEILREIIAIVEEEYAVTISEDSVDVARFVTHLRYLFLRQRQGKAVHESPLELHQALRAARPREYTSAGRIGTLLAERFSWEIATDEILYLALHVSRLVDAHGARR